jgi:GNAT superfamily N-acetyltransferase
VRADPADADPLVEETTEHYRAAGRRCWWWVGPGTAPADLGDRLRVRGFTRPAVGPGMAIDLQDLPEAAPTPDGFTIRAVDDAVIESWCAAMAAGFGMPEATAREVAAFMATVPHGHARPLRHYVGLLGGAPVASSSLLLGAGVAGVYFVATAPSVRRRGLGTAMTLFPLREARALGYRVGVLQASAMGEPLYRRLGFAPCCAMDVYARAP